MSTKKNIVVTGATGTIGRRVVENLAKQKDRRVVAMVRSADKGRALEALGAGTTVGSFEDPASLERAFVEADTVVLITAANANAAEQTIAAIDAAKKAGVRKIVRISALKADPNGPTDNTRQHGRTEAYLRDSDLAYVILRPHFFMQNLLGSLGTIQGEGKLYWGTGDGKMGMVDTRDVADAAALVATTDAFDGGTFELTGPASIDYHAVARSIASALGRGVDYVPIPPEAAADAMRRFGADEWTAGIIQDYCAAYTRGFGDFTTGDLEKITGTKPRSLDDFLREVLVPAASASRTA